MSVEDAALSYPPASPLLLVLSGLSGAGKDAVLSGLEQSGFPAARITTVTTRQRRPGERDGEHYHFISEEKLQEMKAAGELLESASVYGRWYGVPREPVRKALESGQDVVLKVDVQGAVTIKKIAPGSVLIFLAPPSLEELAVRLEKRSTETAADLQRRLQTAEKEMGKLPLFDYLVLNRPGEIDRAVADIRAIYAAEKCRVKSRDISL